MIHLAIPTVAAALLFAIGGYGVVVRRNAILVLISVELMLNAVNLHLVALDLWWQDTLHSGQALTVFVITVAAAEVGVGVAVVLLVFRTRGTVDVDGGGDLGEAVETARSAARLGDGADGSVDAWTVTDEAPASTAQHGRTTERAR